jgi:outer membrane protein, heavy metal efflux system
LSTEIFSIQVARLRLGEATFYETLQARVLATQARAGIIQTRNRYLAEWRRLAASLGLPEMPLTQMTGDIDAPVPRFGQAEVLAIVLGKHTDVLTAANGINRSRLALRLAEVQPIPDVDLRYMAQRDNTTPPFGVVHSLVVGVQMPVFNRNQGAIHAAQANLMRAEEEPARVRNELTTLVAAAFQRYDNARAVTMLYRDQIVPDQVRAYRGIVQRYDRAEGEALNFNDIITSQQTMVEAINRYLESIGEMWDAVVEVANLLQLDDLLSDGVCPLIELDRCPIPELPRAKNDEKATISAKVPLKVR